MKNFWIFISLAAYATVLIVSSCSGPKTSDSPVDSTAVASQAVADADPQGNLYTKISTALGDGDLSTAESLVKENNFDIDKYETDKFLASNPEGTLLFKFTSGDITNPAVVRFLLDHGVDPNKPVACQGEEGCEYAYAITCEREVAEMLLKAKSKYQLDYQVQCLTENNDFGGIRSFIKKGASPNGAIAMTVSKGQIDFLLELARLGADKNEILNQINRLEKKDSSFSPAIRTLVSLGGNPTIPLNFAISNQFGSLTDFLLKAGASKDQALSLSTDYEQIDLVKNLISQGARIRVTNNIANSKNEELKTLVQDAIDGKVYSELGEGAEGISDPSALLTAVDASQIKAVEFMLRAGADPNVYCSTCGNNKICLTSTLGLARNTGDNDMVALLKKYGAKLPEGCD